MGRFGNERMRHFRHGTRHFSIGEKSTVDESVVYARDNGDDVFFPLFPFVNVRNVRATLPPVFFMKYPTVSENSSRCGTKKGSTMRPFFSVRGTRFSSPLSVMF